MMKFEIFPHKGRWFFRVSLPPRIVHSGQRGIPDHMGGPRHLFCIPVWGRKKVPFYNRDKLSGWF